MKTKSFLILLFVFLNTFFTQSQIIDFKDKFELPTEVKETSGLLFLDGKIITHNDSGDAANLYEIDSLSGNLLRTININNATNIDWEDLAEDENHIYIGDIGNNNGNRTDLKIYRILKSDFKNSNSVTADEITFAYQDQTDFTSKPNANNFDAEAFVINDESIFIFSKNWINFTTNVYKLPKSIGNHSAVKVSSANVEGLITGAAHNKLDDSFFLCGYDTNLIPFLIYVSENRTPGDDLFFSGFIKISLQNEIGQGSQVEGITHINNSAQYYISREFFSTSIDGNQFTFPQKLYQFYDEAYWLLSTNSNNLENIKITPNPTSDKIYIRNNKQTINTISVFNPLGKRVLFSKFIQKELDISLLPKGFYLVRIEFQNQKIITRKVIKL